MRLCSNNHKNIATFKNTYQTQWGQRTRKEYRKEFYFAVTCAFGHAFSQTFLAQNDWYAMWPDAQNQRNSCWFLPFLDSNMRLSMFFFIEQKQNNGAYHTIHFSHHEHLFAKLGRHATSHSMTTHPDRSHRVHSKLHYRFTDRHIGHAGKIDVAIEHVMCTVYLF